jgi:Flp pilus assembly protein TadB
MSVISDKDAAIEPVARKFLSTGQTHEQRPAWVIPRLPMAVGVIVVCAGSIRLLFLGNWATLVGTVLLVIFGSLAGGSWSPSPTSRGC